MISNEIISKILFYLFILDIMDNLLKQIMNPLLSDDKMQSNSQGREFNAGQKRVMNDAKKYLDMEKIDTLGGKSKEGFETMKDVDENIQKYQRQVSDMGRAHNQMMRETNELIKFINNPKYRGQTVTIQEVAKSGNALITDGKPITGYVNSSSIFLPSSANQKKANNVIKVILEEPRLVGKKTVPTSAGGPKLYIAQDASTKTPVFLFSDQNQGSVNGLMGAMTGNPLSPNVGENNLDGASSNLFIQKALDTDPSSVSYGGCTDVPSGEGWVKASGMSNNWSYDTCKSLADSQGSKQFALGAESWKLNVIHAGSANKDYSGTYVCGPGMSNDRIAYRNITYNGKDMPVRLLLYPDITQYFDMDGNVLGYLGGSTPWMTKEGPPFGPVKNCWPTFLHPEKLNYYITYVIEDKIWMLVEDVSCAKVAPGDTSIDEPVFLSAACIKPDLAKGDNAFVNFEAPTSKVIATKNASKSRNPLGEWEGSEKITVLLSVGCWYSTNDNAKTSANNAIIVAGHFDGQNTILFDIPDTSSGMVVGVDGLLYASPYIVIGGDSMVNDKSIHKNTDSQINGGFGGSHMVQYYSKIGDKQSTSLCAYHPEFQEDGYPVLKNIKMKFNKRELDQAYAHDEEVRFKHNFVHNYNSSILSSEYCDGGSFNNGAKTSCSDVAPGRTCKNVNLGDDAIDAVQLAEYAVNVAKTEAENAGSFLSRLFGEVGLKQLCHPCLIQMLIKT